MSKELNILCIDTSTEACSVALLRQTATEQKISEQFMLAPREHTAKILPAVEQVLESSGINLSAIDIIAYGRGPGSFTGVRIGISIAQGLAFGIDKNMVGVSTLQAMAQQAFAMCTAEDVYAAIDARMGEVYFAYYRLEGALMVLVDTEVVIKPEDLLAEQIEVAENAVLVGTGWAAYPELSEYFKDAKKIEIDFPNARFMLDQVVDSVNKSLDIAPESASAVYLRDKVTWKKLPGRE
ncbi:tRNA (adenosine(37)-N6)-threonylcarbamoyltransferase complex dimerization subunit type 1 TsaB [Psychromonas sp.]|uniref:tRNA (adenosine(37)-N6)-threonylcarbamoyltransferase complex dimerization subunit type 1 TsaB n=1 Tax=Psychromonas sp. TaxID=1884585 RepID=UPI003562CB70